MGFYDVLFGSKKNTLKSYLKELILHKPAEAKCETSNKQGVLMPTTIIYI